MDIPRFDTANVNLRLALSGIGDAFQEFVHQVLLAEFPQLHQFPGGGKDGAIDLIDTSNGCRVIECKFVGEDDYAAIERRWVAVRNLLDKHLREPSGPTLGQSQYAPWYSSINPITEYWFCVSAVIANEQQRRTLKKAIGDFFTDLATQRGHLAHLQKLNVEIVDWSDLATRLQKQPHLFFRWFPSSRPSGLVPLDEDLDVGTFRAYLSSAKLPYYSLADHLRSVTPPGGATILDEETLLNHFDSQQTTGLIITGKGGVGKSRLTLELGWIGLQRGWSVMRVQTRLKEDALERFAERLSPDQTALFLIDYIETQSDFGEMVESMNVLNDTGVARLRYVAACRTAYYHKAIAASERHLPVDLTPPPGTAVQDWFAGYRQKTIEKILIKAGLPTTDGYLKVCHNIPILAVFLAYLHTSGRSDDLAELLDESEFGQWISKRIQLTFRERSISRELAQLIPLFPMEDATARELPKGIHRSIFDSLATDGWVEKLLASTTDLTESWVTAHDVLADQILLSYVRGIPNTVETFIVELFELGGDLQSLRSALVSLERVSDVVPMNAVHWRKLITDAISLNQESWRGVRDLLIRTTLFSVPDQLFFLYSNNELWTGAESDSGFQKSLGWLARWVVREGQASVAENHKQALISWIARAAPFSDRGNFIITWGLRLAPQVIRDIALSWITTKPALFQTHYLMVAWLDCGMPVNPIALSVRQWCERFARTYHFTFLARAWLDAGGETAVVKDAIKEWLVEYSRNPEAGFVYKSWLDAGGEKAMVAEAIKDWLVEHHRDAEADFVYNAWLNAGGEKAVVEEAIKDWLVEHRTSAEAGHVYKSWLIAGGEKLVVEEAIKDWLIKNHYKAEAGVVYSAWLHAGGEKAVVVDMIKDWLVEHGRDLEAEFVYNAWLNADGKKAVVEDAIKEWLVEHRRKAEAEFVYDAWLDAGGETAMVEEAIKNWLVEHRTSAAASHVYKAWLDRCGDKALVRGAIKDWLSIHSEESDADHVFRAWLESGGERELVWNAVVAWLSQHRVEESAVYVTKFIAKQRNLSADTVKDVLAWCRAFPTNEDALWRLTQLHDNLFVKGIGEDLVSTSEAVLSPLLPATARSGRTTRAQIAALLFALIISEEMQPAPFRERVDSLLLNWLKHPLSFGRDRHIFWSIQQPEFLERIASLIDLGVLDLARDRESLWRFLEWVDEWSPDAKQRARSLLTELKSKYGRSDLWDTVRLAEEEMTS